MGTRNQRTYVTILDYVSGFGGGLVSSGAHRVPANATPGDVIRAKRIELIDQADRARAVVEVVSS